MTHLPPRCSTVATRLLSGRIEPTCTIYMPLVSSIMALPFETCSRRKPARPGMGWTSSSGGAPSFVSPSFEIVAVTGWAPHDSQQKPLRPGSAKMRLADALGTTEQSAGDKAG